MYILQLNMRIYERLKNILISLVMYIMTLYTRQGSHVEKMITEDDSVMSHMFWHVIVLFPGGCFQNDGHESYVLVYKIFQRCHFKVGCVESENMFWFVRLFHSDTYVAVGCFGCDNYESHI